MIRSSNPVKTSEYDAVVIGSGFGGVMAALPLVHAGRRVLMIERGDWVRRGPHNWTPDGVGLHTPHYSVETPYRITSGRRHYVGGSFSCVGGASVFYGGASVRFREQDFEVDREIVGDSGAEWPFRYPDLEPFYSRAEQILHVAGDPTGDPTEPFRSLPYPQKPGQISHVSRRIEHAARRLGFSPSRLPLAINYGEGSRRACSACGTCDGYACAIEAKNDLASSVLPDLLRRGLEVRANTVVVRLVADGGRITQVECVDRETLERFVVHGRDVLLAGGALATPHLLLASELTRLNPGGHTIGRHLMRHRNGVVLGVFAGRPNARREFDKQLAINDFYFGHPTIPSPAGKLGNIQQITPPAGLVKAYLGLPMGPAAAVGVSLTTGMIVIAEDQPQLENGVDIDPSVRDRFGLPQLHVTHHYSARDIAACNALVGKAKQILRAAGAWLYWVHSIDTFSHALGTVRMGTDPATSALDGNGLFRGLENLYVVDASAFPRSAGVNPSLTIAANALRIGERLVARTGGPAAVAAIASRQPLPSLEL